MPQHICPGCGGGNRCEIARTGQRDVKCWCMQVDMPANLGGSIVGAACFCHECATANEKAPSFNEALSAIKR